MVNNNTQEKPLWLELRTEYVDANFDKLVSYLSDNKDVKSDAFFQETLNLLRKRTLELLQNLSSKPLYTFDQMRLLETDANKEQIRFYVRLLGVYMQTNACRNTAEHKSAFIWQQLLLSMICSEQYQTKMLKHALETLLVEAVDVLGYNWDEVHTASPDMLSHKILTQGSFRNIKNEAQREGVGTVVEENGGVRLYAASKADITRQKYTPSVSVFDDKIRVMSLSSNKLKVSEQNSVDAIREFTEDFIAALKLVNPPKKTLRKYDPQDKEPILVRVEEVSYDNIRVRTVDPNYIECTGVLTMNNVFNYSMIDFCKYLKVGNYIYVRLGGLTKNNVAMFDVTPELKTFIMDDCVRCGKTELALSLNHSNGNTMWITENGYIVYTQNFEYELHRYAKLLVTNMNGNGYVYADFEEETTEYFEEQDVRRQLVEDFCILEENVNFENDEKGKVEIIPLCDLAAMATLLYLYQRQIQHPSDRYKMLCVIGILSKMCGNEDSEHLMDFMSQYLRCAIYFAQGKYAKLFDLILDSSIANLPLVERRCKIINILQNFESVQDAALLEAMINDPDEQLSKLATLVQSGCRLKSVLSNSNMNTIKREITRTLSVDDAADTDLDEENGRYMGSEDFNKEFKTSIVFPPNNGMKADTAEQRINVFKTVCAFLNSDTGGTVYLGVNDLGYAVGVEADMKELKANTMDKYLRYITDEAKDCFGLNMMTYVQITAMLDDKVVAIQVKPCDYKLVELEGVAYVRVNAETRRMDEETRASVIARKHNRNRDNAENELALLKAIEGRKCVILHNYRSSNSNDCHDRNVEPFSLAKGRKHVWCYDLESDSVKIFAISRIGRVEILDDKAWSHSAQHQELRMDIFHMTGQKETEVTLGLDTMARNLLVEEFEGSERELIEQKDGTWLLKTKVYSMAGIGRFVIGMIDHVTFVNAPELKAHIQSVLEVAGRKIRNNVPQN